MSISTRMLYWLIIIGLIGNVVFLFFVQINTTADAELAEVKVSGWYYQLEFLANGMLSLASVWAFFKYNRSFPKAVNISYLLLLLLIAVVSARDLNAFSAKPTLFYSPKGLGTWINFGLLYIMAEHAIAPKLIKLFHFLCYFFLIFNLGRLAMVGTIGNRQAAENAIRDTAVFIIWVYPFYFLSGSDKTNLAKIIKYGTLILVAFFAFAISSRSYLLMMIIYLLIKFRRDIQKKENSLLIVIMAGITLLGGYYLAANIENFGSIKGMLAVFTGRIDDDSRTTQLKEFITQFDMDKIFSGVGVTATWNWSSYTAGGYEWLDNQLFLITWWFGIQTCLVYLFYLVYGVLKKNKIGDIAITNAKIIIFLWILACGGFAIYVTISSKLFYYFITLILGFVFVNKRYAKVVV